METQYTLFSPFSPFSPSIWDHDPGSAVADFKLTGPKPSDSFDSSDDVLSSRSSGSSVDVYSDNPSYNTMHAISHALELLHSMQRTSGSTVTSPVSTSPQTAAPPAPVQSMTSSPLARPAGADAFLPMAHPAGADAGAARLFVARIPHTVDQDTFRAYFSSFGMVLDAYLPKDKLTGAPRGIGFVTYATRMAADVVLSVDHTLHGNRLAIDLATQRA